MRLSFSRLRFNLKIKGYKLWLNTIWVWLIAMVKVYPNPIYELKSIFKNQHLSALTMLSRAFLFKY